MVENDDDEPGVAERLGDIAMWLKYLGNGNAATEVGAIEGLAVKVAESGAAIATGLNAVAEALTEIARAIESTRDNDDRD